MKSDRLGHGGTGIVDFFQAGHARTFSALVTMLDADVTGRVPTMGTAGTAVITGTGMAGVAVTGVILGDTVSAGMTGVMRFPF